MRWLGPLALCLCGWTSVAQAQCPTSKIFPQLTLAETPDPLDLAVDSWQIFLGDVPISDAQLALMYGDDTKIERTRSELSNRSVWVFTGMTIASLGAALSSVGWALFGQDNLSQHITLPMAGVGLLVGLSGVILLTESIQRPLEPHLAPTPRHRFERHEARQMVVAINQRLHRSICQASEAAPTSAPVPPNDSTSQVDTPNESAP
ncbi:MAG: hypothetical protein R3C68_02135 [Myxococcota bacterium]